MLMHAQTYSHPKTYEYTVLNIQHAWRKQCLILEAGQVAHPTHTLKFVRKPLSCVCWLNRQSAVRPRNPENVPLDRIFHPHQLSPSHSSTCSTVGHFPTPTPTTVQSKKPHTNQFPFPISKSNLSVVLGSGRMATARTSFSNPELAAARLYRKLNRPTVNLDESVTSQTSQWESICRHPLCESARAHPPSATQSDPFLLSTSTTTTPADSPGRLPSGWEHGVRPLSQ